MVFFVFAFENEIQEISANRTIGVIKILSISKFQLVLNFRASVKATIQIFASVYMF